MKVLIMGRNELLFSVADFIRQSTEHQIVAVVTAKSRPEYKKTEADFERLAQATGARFRLTERVDAETVKLVKESGAEIGISINWVSVIQSDFTQLMKHGIVNAHFGDLPRFRGNAVTNWALLLGETELGLTVHQMEPGELDSGDILVQRKMPVTDSTTIDEINRFAEAALPEMFGVVLNRLSDRTLERRSQKSTGMTPFRCYPRLPQDGKIDWSKSAREIHALVRSLVKPYSGAYTYYRDGKGNLEQLFVWKSRIVEEDTIDVGVPGHVIRNDSKSGEAWIYTGRGVLAIAEASHGEQGQVFVPGEKWKSIRMRLGMDLEAELFQLLRSQTSATLG